MTTMKISLPGSLKAFVDEQASRRGDGTSSVRTTSMSGACCTDGAIFPRPCRLPTQPDALKTSASRQVIRIL